MSAIAVLVLTATVATSSTGPCRKPYNPCELALHARGLSLERRAADCQVDRAADAKKAAVDRAADAAKAGTDLRACLTKLAARSSDVVASEVPCSAPSEAPLISWPVAGIVGLVLGGLVTALVIALH